MPLGLIDVNLYSIDKVNTRIPTWKRKLTSEIQKCKFRFPFFISVKKSNLDKNIVPMYYSSISPISKPYAKRPRTRVIKYKIVRRVQNKTGIDTVYGYVISVK